MNGLPLSIDLTEWETLTPEANPELVGRSLEHDARPLAERLAQTGMLEVSELRTGLLIRAFSHVGTVRLGNAQITVHPKLDQRRLLDLLRYAYGFRKLTLVSEAAHRLEGSGFVDLLVGQLLAEVRELLARGLHRAYTPKAEWLSTPRGRLDVHRLVMRGGTIESALPCTHHPRVEDSTLNRVLLAGIALAGAIASDIHLRREARRLTSLLADTVSSIRLGAEVLQSCLDTLNRLTSSYEPALAIIRLLSEARGVCFSGETDEMRLPGFLFDMNRLFQALVSRFLHDGLPAHTIRDEHRLRGMIEYAAGFNPRRRRAPNPRPDFVIFEGTRAVAVLDAKYRDLWDNPLPRDMLYQLAVYAIGHAQGSATILFPTLDNNASEARLDVRDPIHGRLLAQVNLRPVNLPTLQTIALSPPSPSTTRRRQALAEQLAFGTTPSADAAIFRS